MIVVLIALGRGVGWNQFTWWERSWITACGSHVDCERAPVGVPSQASVLSITVEIYVIWAYGIDHWLSHGVEIDRTTSPSLAIVAYTNSEVASILDI